MEILLLGTAAAEAWPAPFCACAACREARKRGGPDIRGRSGALLDGVVKVDFGPDTVAQMQALGRDLSEITSLIFTHPHEDHLTPTELQYRGSGFCTDTDLPLLHVYGGANVIDILRDMTREPSRSEERLRMVLEPALQHGQEVTTPDGTTILPATADHAPGSLVLRLTRGGRTVYYGHDSGLLPDASLEALGGVPLDVALFDCTCGMTKTGNRGHMDVDGVIETIKRLRSVGAVTETTQLVATHFSHNGQALHDQLRDFFEPQNIAVAYDGLTLTA